MEDPALDVVPEAAREVPVEKASRGVGLSSGVIFAISVVIQLIGYASTYFFSHGIGSTNSGQTLLGLVQFNLLVASSINGIGDLRIGSAYTFYIARGKKPEAATGTYLLLRLLMVGIAGVSLWLALGPSLTSRDPSISLAQIQLALGVFLALPILWSISTVFTQLTIAQGESIRSQYPLLLESIVRTTFLIFVATHSPTFLTITFAYIPGAIVSTVYSFPRVWRHFRGYSHTEAVGLFRFAWPLMGSLMLLYIASNGIGFLLVALVSNGTRELALFNAANGFRILVLGIPAAVVVPLFPSLSSLHARGLIHRLRAQTWNALRFTAMAVVPAAAALVAYRTDFLVLFYGTHWASASVALEVLAMSTLPASLAMVIGTVLSSVRLQRLEFYLTSVQVTLLFVNAAVLLPPLSLLSGYGVTPIVAASIATLTSSVVALAVNTYFMERYLQVRIGLRPIVTIALAGAVAFGCVFLLDDYLNPNRWYTLLVTVGLAFIVYYLVLALVGELSKDDVRQLAGMVALPAGLTAALQIPCWRQTTPYSEVLERLATPDPGADGVADPDRPAPRPPK